MLTTWSTVHVQLKRCQIVGLATAPLECKSSAGQRLFAIILQIKRWNMLLVIDLQSAPRIVLFSQLVH